MVLLALSLSAFAVSLLFLYLGSKKVVQAASCLAYCLNLNRAVVGTVFVALVTAFPELLSSLFAIFLDSSNLALGNIIGSNIYNIPLIIGIIGLVREFKMENSSINKECFFMTGLGLLFTMLVALTGMVTWWMGVIFMSFYPVFIYYSIHNGNNHTQKKPEYSLAKTGASMVLGACALVSGTFLLVYAAINIAEIFGLQHFYAGLTIVALGCIVPETAVSVAAALRGEQEISLGNVVGDNIITITLGLGLIGLIRPFTVSLFEVLKTAPFMIIVTLMPLLMNKMSYKITKPWSFTMLSIAFLAIIVHTVLPY